MGIWLRIVYFVVSRQHFLCSLFEACEMAPEKDSETFLMKDTHARKRRMQNE